MASEEAAAEGDAGSSLLLNQPVVIDNGTSTLKAGFAGSSKPKVRIFEHWYIILYHMFVFLYLTVMWMVPLLITVSHYR